ncbi:MAG: FMN-binding protein [Robiginitomaculum sp.]
MYKYAALQIIGRTAILCALLFIIIPASHATGANAHHKAFLNDAFTGQTPAAKTLWLSKDQHGAAKAILRHKYAGLRVRYRQEGARTVWVLDEIGKYKPITIGVVIDGGKIKKLTVLDYRESHGWEVKHDFFTHQFIGAHLTEKSKLEKPIDGISGATLSVRALKKLARLSLYFDSQVQDVEPRHAP